MLKVAESGESFRLPHGSPSGQRDALCEIRFRSSPQLTRVFPCLLTTDFMNTANSGSSWS